MTILVLKVRPIYGTLKVQYTITLAKVTFYLPFYLSSYAVIGHAFCLGASQFILSRKW